jgi:peptide/nickel transport system permease protein
MREALPGDVVDVLAAERFYSDSEKDRLREQLGFNDGFGTYYVTWMGNAVTGDFGASLRTERDIGADLLLRFPVTIELAILGLLFAMAISLPLGVISAIKRNTWVDYSARSAAVFALAIPGFWLATLAVVFGAKWFGWSPPLGFEQIYDDPLTNLSQMWLPALLYGLILAGVQTRILRTALLEVLRQDYIRTARAKGLTGRLVITRHALRNSLIPYITILGVQFPVILGGAVVFEVIFSLPGVATFLIDAINNRDFTVVQAVNVWLAALVITITLVVDLSYAFIDPRIRLS